MFPDLQHNIIIVQTRFDFTSKDYEKRMELKKKDFIEKYSFVDKERVKFVFIDSIWDIDEGDEESISEAKFREAFARVSVNSLLFAVRSFEPISLGSMRFLKTKKVKQIDEIFVKFLKGNQLGSKTWLLIEKRIELEYVNLELKEMTEKKTDYNRYQKKLEQIDSVQTEIVDTKTLQYETGIFGKEETLTIISPWEEVTFKAKGEGKTKKKNPPSKTKVGDNWVISCTFVTPPTSIVQGKLTVRIQKKIKYKKDIEELKAKLDKLREDFKDKKKKVIDMITEKIQELEVKKEIIKQNVKELLDELEEIAHLNTVLVSEHMGLETFGKMKTFYDSPPESFDDQKQLYLLYYPLSRSEKIN